VTRHTQHDFKKNISLYLYLPNRALTHTHTRARTHTQKKTTSETSDHSASTFVRTRCARNFCPIIDRRDYGFLF
jgi:hypothetical protein